VETDTSPTAPTASLPVARIESTAAFTDSASRSFTTIRAPSAAKRRAAASPCPRPAPVISATRPCSCPIGILLFTGPHPNPLPLTQEREKKGVSQNREYLPFPSDVTN